MMEMLQPDLIAPIVAWLCHEDCKDNGAIIEAAGGWAGKCKQNICRGCYPGVNFFNIKHAHFLYKIFAPSQT